MPPSILEENTRTALAERIRRLSPDSPRQWGTLSAKGMLCHAADVLQQALGRRESPFRGNILSCWVLKPLVLYAMPIVKGAPTAPGLDPSKSGTQPADFELDRQRVLDLLEENAARPIDQPFATHPFFGPMSHKERGILSFKHLDHHLHQFGV